MSIHASWSSRLASLVTGASNDFVPSIAALIPLNIFAAFFPHEHSDITMRMLHAYTSIGLAAVVLICMIIVSTDQCLKRKTFAVPLIALSATYCFTNTNIVITGMGGKNGAEYHAMEAAILFSGYFISKKLAKAY